MANLVRLRNENCGLRLRSVLESALEDPTQSWVWSQCQACPQCFVLVRREDGCSHLVCRCGCDFCFRCGGHLSAADLPCCCDEFHLYTNEDRAFLGAWLALKHESHSALGSALSSAIRDELRGQLAQLPGAKHRLILAERARAAAEQARIQEQARNEWARQQVHGTTEALQMRSMCESFGLLLWQAGADVPEPCLLAAPENREEAFDGLLVNSTFEARAEDHENLDNSDWEGGSEFDYDDEPCAKTQRRAMHGAPRRVLTEKAWVAHPNLVSHGKEKEKARVPAHPRRQKRALVIGARQDVAKARRLRTARQAARAASHRPSAFD